MNQTQFNNDRAFDSLTGFEQITALTEAVKNAYYLKNREIPANMGNIVELLRKQILKRVPKIGARMIHENIESYIMNETTGAISADILFKAACRGYDMPKGQRSFDVDLPVRPDTEQDTILLLDTIADTVSEGRKPYANWHREYIYLVHKGCLDLNSCERHMDKAYSMLREYNASTGRRGVDYDAPQTIGDVTWRAEALAVIDWISAIGEQGKRPSDVLLPIADEQTYRRLRETV